MTKLLVAAFDKQGMVYVHHGQQMGMDVRVLDCFDSFHPNLTAWYGEDMILRVHGRRSDVTAAVVQEGFDAAVVHETSDFIRTALIVQSLAKAGIKRIAVVTNDIARRAMYRRCGAHRVLISPTEEQAWSMLARYLPVFESA